ncbi:MAG: ABC transporter ATP-binding protein [Thermodesulfobacteriota bacterium]
MLLEVSNLSIRYGDIEAVRQVDVSVNQGELVSIIGANGAGKTSILNGIMGLVSGTRGTVRFDGVDISHLAPFERARRGMRIVPERARVFPRLTVFENLMTGVYGIRRKLDVSKRLSELHALFPILKERSSQPAATLSGGEQQQVAIARALISKPSLLLVDEVSMGLMPKLVDQVFEVLLHLNREQGLTILLVEQNAMASLAISDRAYVLETGTCVFSGRAEVLMRDPKLKAAYLG